MQLTFRVFFAKLDHVCELADERFYRKVCVCVCVCVCV